MHAVPIALPGISVTVRLNAHPLAEVNHGILGKRENYG